MPASPDTYTHGHSDAVLRSHRWRTAKNSAAYLLHSLREGQRLLDVGSGPGTVTMDLARLVAPGEVVGIDAAQEVVNAATAAALETGVPNVTFATGDAYALDFPDASFDVVHAHQLLQHLREPVACLSEMRRVLRPDGILAVRDSDYAGFVWAPADPLLDRWMELYSQVTRQNGGEPNAGRHLLGWVIEAGFPEVRATSSTWTFADAESRRWWGGLWAERVLTSGFAEQAQGYGLANVVELERIAAAWQRWAEREDGFFALLHGEVLARS